MAFGTPKVGDVLARAVDVLTATRKFMEDFDVVNIIVPFERCRARVGFDRERCCAVAVPNLDGLCHVHSQALMASDFGPSHFTPGDEDEGEARGGGGVR